MSDSALKLEMNSIEAVMHILIFTVYADRKKRPQEIAQLWHQVPKLSVFTDDNGFPNAEGLVFEHLITTAEKKVIELIDSNDLLFEIDSAIKRIDSPILAPIILSSMQAIAHADNEYHPSEHCVITRASELWGLSPA
ncbi:MAG: hypothetical protein COB59_00370 [Rhodospirillaceae bacterium]|nr:MAG: hypothetical protein COB59_00370 [Rhodospirillaceae bacterium]